jgi:hypothetical protein
MVNYSHPLRMHFGWPLRSLFSARPTIVEGDGPRRRLYPDGVGRRPSMGTPDFGLIVLAASLALAGIVVPVTAVAFRHHRRRAHERAAGVRRKQKIRL